MALERHVKLWLLLLTLLPALLYVPVISDSTNGFAFQFTRKFYNVTVYENSPAKTYLRSIHKMGIYIENKSWDVRFRIVSGDDDNIFKAEEDTVGDFCFFRIRTKGGGSVMLNREVKDHYQLKVKAHIRGNENEAWTVIHVEVLDVNDLRPLFFPTSYSVNIAEDAALGASIAQVTATDADVGSSGEFYYRLHQASSQKNKLFAVHPTSGVIILTGKLDADHSSSHNLEIETVDRSLQPYGSNGMSSRAKMRIHVRRINRHAPVISIASHKPSPDGQDPIFGLLSVKDEDTGENGQIALVEIIAGDETGQFKVFHLSGEEFCIKAVDSIDWANHPFGFNLTLQARDKGTPPRSSSDKQLSIHGPRSAMGSMFVKAKYHVTISGFSPANTTVLMLKANSSVERLRYFIRKSPDSEFFQINEKTGLIVTAQCIMTIQKDSFEFEVGTDIGTAMATVLVSVAKVNRNPPVFEKMAYRISVDENVPVHTTVLQVHATDKDVGDDGYVTYSIANTHPLPFVIDTFSGIISTSSELDHETMSRLYHLRIRASDWGSPFRRESEVNVTIIHNNQNDNRPKFEKVDCTGTIPRNMAVGDTIDTVSAIDEDNLEVVRYHIISGNEKDLFELSETSGILKLKRFLKDVHFKSVKFSLKISASDGNKTAVPMFYNLTIINRPQSEKVLECRNTGVAKVFAEKLHEVAKLKEKLQADEAFLGVLSVNKHPPRFASPQPWKVEVQEGQAGGTMILDAQCFDPDSGFNGKLVYSLAGGNERGNFDIGVETGMLTVLTPLDREEFDHYVLNVTVYDLGQPQLAAWQLLTVIVLDANDCAPTFQFSSYHVTVREDTVKGTAILEVKAVDRDLGENGEVYYYLLSHKNVFHLDNLTGVLSILNPLDREVQAKYVLRVEARDRATREKQQSSVTTVEVNLMDVNDNAPQCLPGMFRTRVPEDLPIGTLIGRIEARDPDLGAGGQVFYDLQDQEKVYFELDRITGALRLATKLDFETRQFYNFTVQAKDQDLTRPLASTCHVELEVVDVDENVHTPLFPHFVEQGFVFENATLGTVVMKVNAIDEDLDRDGLVRYSIRDGSGLGVFSIQPQTGEIRTARRLDHETAWRYWLTVYATDQAVVPRFSTLEVYIEVGDVNDNAPQPTEAVYFASVPENSPEGVSVVQVQAFDPDTETSDGLIYDISSGNPQGFFSVNQDTGLVSTTARRLDREKQAEHKLEVTVTDTGTPPLRSVLHLLVHVQDVNDNNPSFPERSYKVSLPAHERSLRRELLFRVFASDADEGPNAELSYSIEEGNDEGKFFIEPTTGRVSSKEAFAVGEYNILTIKAVDNGRPQLSSTAKLHFNWIARPDPAETPVAFLDDFVSVTVMEDTPIGDMVTMLNTHAATIRVAQALDTEKTSVCNLTISASDGTSTATVEIRVLDINEHMPEFSMARYEVKVHEAAPPGHKLLQLNATDRDMSSKLTYTILGSSDTSGPGMFRLDYSTGWLSIAKSLDYETNRYHMLTVMSFKNDKCINRRALGGFDTNSLVMITLIPLFIVTMSLLLCKYMAMENVDYNLESVGSCCMILSTNLNKNHMFVSILCVCSAGNVGKSFSIDPVLGIISVAKELNQSVVSRYDIIARATDGGDPALSASTTITILVTISNNAAPKFSSKEYSAEISENAQPGMFVITVSAISRSSSNYELIDGNVRDVFEINSMSGVISLRDKLDFEKISSYNIIVQATNMAGRSTNTTVKVHLKDENDNAPTFVQSYYMGIISEAAPAKSVVLNDQNSPLVIKATDADSGPNSLLVYQIVESTARRCFSIDSSTGAIKTISKLDHESMSVFHFNVQVTDVGIPRLLADTPANVTVTVLDVNDSPPEFSEEIYETVLLIPTYKGVQVITLKASDPDTGLNSTLSYSITSGNVGNKFSIDLRTGAIVVQNRTNLRSRYELSVRVFDGKFSGSTLVKVTVQETTENGLKVATSYSADVVENTTDVKTLAVISTMGALTNEPLTFRILNPSVFFAMKSTAGVLQTTGIPFDREEQEIYEVVVEIRDVRSPPRIVHTIVSVNVVDVNDNSPIFANLPYYAIVQVDAQPGDLIYKVMAVDQDVKQNGQIRYFVETPDEYFKIDPSSGSITLLKTFNPGMSGKEFPLTVTAEDHGTPSLSSQVVVPITVINKAMPIFDRSFYSTRVAENVEPHTAVLHLQANSPEGLPLFFSITDGDPFNQFSMDFNTGTLTVLGSLDYETQSLFRLMARATDSLTGVYTEVPVDVTVEDINDNAPIFRQSSYSTVLSEAALIGTSVLRVSATDADAGSNQHLYYQIVDDGTNNSNCFYIDSGSGLILTSRFLDFEQVQVHHFKVRASDGSVPPLTSDIPVQIQVTDTNDNSPVFNQLLYEAFVSEVVPRGHFVTRVQASDADNCDTEKLRYSILSGNGDSNFVIDGKSGIISTLNLRKENMARQYQLNISVSDGVFTSTARVHINILSNNLHTPFFRQHEFMVHLPENPAIRTFVMQVQAEDEDMGHFSDLSYSITNQFAARRFTVDEIGQMFTISGELDRENAMERVIDINLMAMDGGGRAGYCTVKVVLTDKNDNSPQFGALEYRASMLANVPKGNPVLQVSAMDHDEGNNSVIEFSFIHKDPGTSEDILQIDSSSGVILTKESLVGLEGRRLSLFVKAEDRGAERRHTIVPLYVHILPEDITQLPAFPKTMYMFTVLENVDIGSTVGSVRLSSNESIRYHIAKGVLPESNSEEQFTVDANTGRLKVVKKLDYEVTRQYNFLLTATYQHENTPVHAQVPVTVIVRDVNDNSPTFESEFYNAMVMENLPIGTPVIQVRAMDLDFRGNGKVVYYLPHVADVFAVDRETGWIRTLQGLDRELQAEHTFRVSAQDLGNPAHQANSAVVRVHVVDSNDCPPQFSAGVYTGSVMEGVAPGQVIAVLRATDADLDDSSTHLVYYLTGGDPRGEFSIAKIQEEWTVHTKRPLDREHQEHYLLNVTATDGTFTSQAVVDVTVLDANDNDPVCHQLHYAVSVEEDTRPHERLLQVKASDVDEGDNAALHFSLSGPGGDAFHMNPNTGELFTLATLDREEQAAYTLIAVAKDGGGRSCQTEISVRLGDVNDNAPVFSSPHYDVSVSESTAVGSLLIHVQATDSDLELNRKVLYTMVDSAGGHFAIDQESGIVSLIKALDREERAIYNATVRATDQGISKQLFSEARISVTALDVNDSPPAFEHREYETVVPEDAALSTKLITVFAISQDQGRNAEITYSIIGGNQHKKFQINPKSGIITLAATLDYEASHDYYLTVQASDGGSPSLSGLATVSINVSDVNDHAPTFSRSSYSFLVVAFLLKVVAEDQDGPSNNQLMYSVESGNTNDLFYLDRYTGVLSVQRPLDREEVSGYSLIVAAVDNGTPSQSTTIIVNINISDINDNPPSFSEDTYRAVLQVPNVPETRIVKLLVNDLDATHNGPPFSFSIVSGDDGRRFRIDEEGVIYSAIIFGSAERQDFHLTVQATDSGRPSLSSTCEVIVSVTEESVHSPHIIPLEVVVVTTGDEFGRGVIGKVHATDQDAYDTLTYSLYSDRARLFTVNSRDGKIIAQGSLDVGQYNLTIAVSDGKHTVRDHVRVRVHQATESALLDSIVVRFADVTPEEFLATHLPSLQRFLRSQLKDYDVQMLSLQESSLSGALDVLLAPGRTSGMGWQRSKLQQVLRSNEPYLKNTTGLRLVQVVAKPCTLGHCPSHQCMQRASLDKSAMSAYSTARLSIIVPKHHLSAFCTCEGTEPPTSLQLLCFSSFIPGLSTLSFNGKSYVKYHLHERNLDSKNATLSFILLTMQPNGVLLYIRGSKHIIIVEVGLTSLQLRFNCGGSGFQRLKLSNLRVDDGYMHNVLLTFERTRAWLKVNSEEDSMRMSCASGGLNTLVMGMDFYLGGIVRNQQDARQVAHGDAIVSNGFNGCLESPILNGYLLPLQQSSSIIASREGSANLEYTCPFSGCGLGEPALVCSSLFFESSFPLLCLVSSSRLLFWFFLFPVFPSRCQARAFCGTPFECTNGARCIDSLEGPICLCQPGFSGLRCEFDVNECAVIETCKNGGTCQNTNGSFYCICTHGNSGRNCTKQGAVSSNKVWFHHLGLFTILLVVCFIAVCLLYFRRRICRCCQGNKNSTLMKTDIAASFPLTPKPCGLPANGRPTSREGTGIAYNPPQVPVRPMAYTPSMGGEPREHHKRSAAEGAQSTSNDFGLDGPHLGQRVVAVCSVAPHFLPPAASNSSFNLDCAHKTGWDVTCGCAVRRGTVPPRSLHQAEGHDAHDTAAEQRSLSSCQSDACDDNGLTWDTSDWMSPPLEEMDEFAEGDYYLGGCDVDNELPPQQDNLYVEDREVLQPLCREGVPRSPGLSVRNRPGFHPSQYLPPHAYPCEPAARRTARDYGLAFQRYDDEYAPLSVIPGFGQLACHDSEQVDEPDGAEEFPYSESTSGGVITRHHTQV
uniref:FAT atypical cadherin 1 n=1 Tax=Eptatretus burgeri TaxID=7764 RepID=A0A8C4NG34_EPTBU